MINRLQRMHTDRNKKVRRRKIIMNTVSNDARKTLAEDGRLSVLVPEENPRNV